jgi:hypothetical protein
LSILLVAKAPTGRGSLAKRQAAQRSGCRARAGMREAGGRIGRLGLPLGRVGRADLLQWAARSIRRFRMRLARMCWRNSTTNVDSGAFPLPELPCTRSSASRPARNWQGRGNCLHEASLTYAAMQHSVSLALLDNLVRRQRVTSPSVALWAYSQSSRRCEPRLSAEPCASSTRPPYHVRDYDNDPPADPDQPSPS